MDEILIIENKKLLEVLNSDDVCIKKFTDMINMLMRLSYKLILSEKQDYLMEIYQYMFSKSRENEDVRIISSVFERVFSFIQEDEHKKRIEYLKILSHEESNSFSDILEKASMFRNDISMIGYKLDDIYSIRNISNVDDLKKILLLFCNYIQEMDKFVDRIKSILYSLNFDDNILESMSKLNDGFNNRRKEIIYHLFCIDKEIPLIVHKNSSGYKEIGESISLNCSPERDRNTVKTKLTKRLKNIDINCELHTKMRILSNKPPDRIYFCPIVPNGLGELSGKIYIYKITKHV